MCLLPHRTVLNKNEMNKFWIWNKIYIYVYINILFIFCLYTAQEWNILTLAVHERVDSWFLVLAGSELKITEITEYRYFNP